MYWKFGETNTSKISKQNPKYEVNYHCHTGNITYIGSTNGAWKLSSRMIDGKYEFQYDWSNVTTLIQCSMYWDKKSKKFKRELLVNVQGETTKVRKHDKMVPLTFQGEKIANVLFGTFSSINFYPKIKGMPIGSLEIVFYCDYGIGKINRYLK